MPACSMCLPSLRGKGALLAATCGALATGAALGMTSPQRWQVGFCRQAGGELLQEQDHFSQQSLQAVLCDICSAPHRHGRTGPRPAVSEARQLLPPSMHTMQSSCNAPRGAGTPLGSPLLIAEGLIATVVRTIVSLPGLEGQSLTAYSITSHASRQCFGLCRRWRGTYF